MPSPTETHLTREQLYDLAWSKPLAKVAADFGTTRFMLAKSCRKLNVPVPPSGYWMRRQHGHADPRPPLPPAPANTPENIVLRPRELSPEGRIIDLKVDFPVRISTLHPTVVAIEKEMGPVSRPDELFQTPGASVRVSTEVRPRLLRLLHVLFTALEGRGASVRLGQAKWDSHPHIMVFVDGRGVRVSIGCDFFPDGEWARSVKLATRRGPGGQDMGLRRPYPSPEDPSPWKHTP